MSLFGLFGPPNIEKLKAKRDVQGLLKALSYQKTVDARGKRARMEGRFDLALKLEEGVSNIARSVRVPAAKALGQIGDKQAVEPLIAILKEGAESQLCGAAAEALGEIGDTLERLGNVNADNLEQNANQLMA